MGFRLLVRNLPASLYKNRFLPPLSAIHSTQWPDVMDQMRKTLSGFTSMLNTKLFHVGKFRVLGVVSGNGKYSTLRFFQLRAMA